MPDSTPLLPVNVRITPPGLIRAALALTAILLTVWAQWGAAPTSSVLANEWLRDAFVRLQASTAPEPRVLVVDIDEASLATLGAWPWPHARVADLVETLLTHYSARGVALDIVLPEPKDTAGDQRLALLAQHGPVVLAQMFDYNFGRPDPVRDGQPAGASSVYRDGGVKAAGYIANHAGLAQARHVGNMGFLPDSDGALRRVPLLTSYEGRQYPALALALVNCCNGGAAMILPTTGLMRVDYKRDWSAYTVVSAADILNQAIEPASAGGRLVIVGSSSLGIGDRVTTPFRGDRPGLGVQAAVLSTLLDRQGGLAPAPWPGRLLAIAFAVLCTVGASFAFPRLSAVASVGLLGGASLLWLGLAYSASSHDPDFSTTGPLATNLFLLAFAVPYQWHLAQRTSRHLLDTLRQYVAPEVVAQLLRSDVRDPLRPRRFDVTTVIADMEGYTTQVESLPVEAAAKLTRDFLDCLTGPVIDQQGTLDKYTGDGLVAFWGAPLPLAQHADLALEAALSMVRRVARLSDERVRNGFPPLRVRIGIDSGLAMAGDFGTSFRSIYTAVGDSVNTASRLEQAAREFKHDIIVGAGTVERARRHRFILLGERMLRGKEKPTTLFTFDSSMDSAPRYTGQVAPAMADPVTDGPA
ncbi:CHASE2 domain-containing protein [Massilia eurypsychrophila]|uniref:CHASE2 domain-containing protein n=1 Tax=Massilia eurypsychrophila TaxID=1485217 RepID=UPI001E35A078|nr:adenylate/guanylate cyclase domain-containing protein [Massilia eurypsychrophila]